MSQADAIPSVTRCYSDFDESLGPEELVAFETDALAGFVLAWAADR